MAEDLDDKPNVMMQSWQSGAAYYHRQCLLHQTAQVYHDGKLKHSCWQAWTAYTAVRHQAKTQQVGWLETKLAVEAVTAVLTLVRKLANTIRLCRHHMHQGIYRPPA